jgi:SAM-dependent methyltransferase
MASFLAWYRAGSGISILDVGGTPEFWSESGLDDAITVLNLAPEPEGMPERMAYVQGSATELPFEDGSFDVVFSNSMIEHLGEWANQERFAREALRVGRGLWIQTPARWFPIEPHLLTPVVHYLPKGTQRHLLRNFTVWGWVTRPDQDEVDRLLDELALLTAAQMQALFPGCTLERERFLGLTKSLMIRKAPV